MKKIAPNGYIIIMLSVHSTRSKGLKKSFGGFRGIACEYSLPATAQYEKRKTIPFPLLLYLSE